MAPGLCFLLDGSACFPATLVSFAACGARVRAERAGEVRLALAVPRG